MSNGNSTEPGWARELLGRHTAALLATARGLDELTADSLCEGWTRAHVLTHIARNADAIGRLASWAVTGERAEMYPGGTEARNAEIAAGAVRPPAEIVADLEQTSAEVAASLERLDGPIAAPVVEMRGGKEVDSQQLPFLRLREVVIHHVDLKAGFEFGDVEPDLVLALLEDAVARLEGHPKAPNLQLRTDQGDAWSVGEDGDLVSGTRPGMLLWLARRLPAGVTGEPVPALPRGA
jgi:maleylpyruvate isomerase